MGESKGRKLWFTFSLNLSSIVMLQYIRPPLQLTNVRAMSPSFCAHYVEVSGGLQGPKNAIHVRQNMNDNMKWPRAESEHGRPATSATFRRLCQFLKRRRGIPRLGALVLYNLCLHRLRSVLWVGRERKSAVRRPWPFDPCMRHQRRRSVASVAGISCLLIHWGHFMLSLLFLGYPHQRTFIICSGSQYIIYELRSLTSPTSKDTLNKTRPIVSWPRPKSQTKTTLLRLQALQRASCKRPLTKRKVSWKEGGREGCRRWEQRAGWK